MPRVTSKLGDRSALAVAQLEPELVSLGARRLAKHELELYRKRQFVAGWRLPFAFDDTVGEMDLLVRADVPFVPLRIALTGTPPFLIWPHVEEDGMLCIWPEAASFSSRDVLGVTKKLLCDAEDLITKSARQENRDDFLTEFNSYWSKSLGTNPTLFLSLIEPSGPSRLIRVCRRKGVFVFGESDPAITAWVKNRFGTKSVQCDQAAFLWLDRLVYPEEYPKTAKDVFDISRNLSDDAADVLARLSEVENNRAVVVFGAMTKNGPCLAGVTISAPQHRSSGGKLVNSLQNGFRPGHAPISLLANRFWHAGAPVQRSPVSRIDGAWIHGRGLDQRQPVLTKRKIAIIGCGSVGAPIAVQLAMAGVGEIRFIDPGSLEPANTGRHPLGAKYVNKNKAQSLADELMQMYPHSRFAARPKRWQDVMREESELLTSCDLVLSATGDWGSESELNDWHLGTGRTPPILYVWTEEHACAGHAVAIMRRGGCLECGFRDSGIARFPITVWPSETVKQEPGCGALFQPYGPMELAHTVTLGAELALDVLLGKIVDSAHRIWACREEFLVESGGQWSPEWMDVVGGDTYGGLVRLRAWLERSNCIGCSAKGMAA